MEQTKSNHHIKALRISFIGIGIIIPIALYFFPGFYKKISPKSTDMDFVISMLSIIICITAQSLFEIINKITQACEIAERNSADHDAFKNALIPKQLHFLFEGADRVNAKILLRTIPDYVKSLQYEDDKFTLSGDYWSHYCYEQAWLELIQRQRLNPKERIIIQALDLSYVRLSKSGADNQTKVTQYISLQRRFLEAGGKIERIFLIENQSDEALIKTMFKELYDIKKSSYISHFLINQVRPSGDFFIAKNSNNSEVLTICTWHYDYDSSETPSSISFSTDNIHSYQKIWDRYHSRIRFT